MNTPPVTSIRDVQNDALPSGAPVQLSNVVITAIDTYGARVGDIYVQEQSGAPEFSGIKVFGVTTEQLLGLAVGDVVTINGGEKDEFALDFDTSGRTVTEIVPVTGGMMTVTKTGTGTIPAPAMVDAKAIEALTSDAERDAAWEKWEGVLITVINARQTNAVNDFASSGVDPAPDQFQFSISGNARVQTAMSAFPSPEPVAQTCYAGITGIGDYFLNYLVHPRMASDLVGGGTGCAVAPTATVTSIQMGMTTGAVTLPDVIVTGRDEIGGSRGLWVADALMGAEHNGIFVFTGGMVPAADIGAHVSVTGTVTEFDLGSMGNPPVGDTITEIDDGAVALVSAPAGAPTPATVAANVLNQIGAAGEPWEGVLVRVVSVKVTNADAGQGKVELTDNNGAKLIMDNESFNWPMQTVGTCYDVVGLMHVQVNDDLRTINPRSAADFVTSTSCTP